jgi:hypothetical protein
MEAAAAMAAAVTMEPTLVAKIALSPAAVAVAVIAEQQ